MRGLIRRLFFRASIRRDLNDEIESHLEMRARLNLSEGMSEEDAYREACRRFGNRRRIEEDTRAVYVVRWLEAAIQDVRFSIRSFVRRAGASLLVILTLTLGIGATTATYAVVRHVLLRPLPFEQGDDLVRVWSVNANDPLSQRVSYPDFVDWREESRTLDMVGWGGYEVTLTGRGDPEKLTATLFLGDLFGLLGVPPALGSIDELEDVGSSGPAVVLSDGVWRRRFGSDPEVVGRAVTLDGVAYTLAAVMPAGFRFPIEAWPPVDLWVPLARFNPVLAERRDARVIDVAARLGPGVDIAQAQAEMDGISTSLAQRYPETNRDVGVRLVAAVDEATGAIAPGLWTLFAGAFGLLLIASVNVASLFLVRASARGREFAVRTALGAGRMRIARQVLVEGGLMALLGGVAGGVLAYWGVRAFVVLIPPDTPRVSEIEFDAGAAAFAILTALAMGVLVSLAPVWRAARGRPGAALSGGRTATEGLPGRRLRAILVVSQVALATILLTGAGLLTNSFWRLNRPDSGFEPNDVLTFSVDWPPAAYPRPAEVFRELRLRLLAVPGVETVSTGIQLPDRGLSIIDDVSPFVARIEGQPVPDNERERAAFISTQPGYFAALGIPLVGGRDFTDQDTADVPRIAIVNEAWARTYFPGENPLGKHFALSSWTLAGGGPAEIVGIARDVKHDGLAREAQPLMYLPFEQQPAWESTVILRTRGDPLQYAGAVREAVRSLDPDQPIYDLQTLGQRVSGALAEDRLRASVLGSFSTIAVLLAGVGLFSVLSYVMAARTREIGIRIALGADLWSLRAMVLGQGMRLAVAGIVVGALCAAGLSQLMANLLFGIAPADPETFLAVAVILMLVAAVACWTPMRYATKIDAARSLRFE